MARVLLGFAAALAAPEALFSLHAAGHEVRFFDRDGRRRAPVLSLPGQAAPALIPAPEADAATATEALRAAQRAAPADVVLPLDDASLQLVNVAFGADAAPLGDAPMPRLACAAGAQAAAALDKTVQIEAARAAGLPPPPAWIARTAQELAAALAEVPLPAIVKPALVARLVDGRLRRDAAVYALARCDLDVSALPLPAIVQPLIHGTGEGVFGFATPAGVVAWSGHRRLRMMNPHGSGASACRSRRPAPEETAAVGRLVEGLGWRGPFMVELLRPECGPPLFMELNGRLWGSLALARRGGHEHPAWAVAQALDPAFVPAAPPIPDGLEVRHLGRELLHLMFLLRGPKTDFHRRDWPRLLPALAAVLRPGPGRGFYDHDPSAPRFFLREAAANVIAALRR